MSAVGAEGPGPRREIFTSRPTRRHLRSPRPRHHPRLRLGKENTKDAFKECAEDKRRYQVNSAGQKPQGEQET